MRNFPSVIIHVILGGADTVSNLDVIVLRVPDGIQDELGVSMLLHPLMWPWRADREEVRLGLRLSVTMSR